MRIQPSFSNYLGTGSKGISSGLSTDLFMKKDNKYGAKAKYEIKNENGYIRHYVTKINGERILVKEVKQPKGQEENKSTGELVDVIRDKLMNQLAQTLDQQNADKLTKSGLAGQKEKQLEKYKLSI
ncbi:MAG: hypothetical protein RR651_08210 [Lysinibacillus sp.]